MKKYELLFVLPGTLDEAEAAARSKQIFSMVEENGSEVQPHTLGKNRLAYPVKQIRYGYFYTAVFNADPEKVNALQKKLNIQIDLLRTMISFFNADVTANQKISMTTADVAPGRLQENSTPVVVQRAAEEVVPAVAVTTPEPKIDMKEIDKKLDEILDNSIVAGV